MKKRKIIDVVLATCVVVSIILLAVSHFSTSGAKSAPKDMTIEKRLEVTLDIALKVAKKSGDEEAVKVAQYLKKNMVPGFARSVDQNSINVEQMDSNKKDQQLIVLVPREFLSTLKRQTSKGLRPEEMAAWYNPEDEVIYIAPEEGLTNMDIVLQLLHEGDHAVRLKGKKVLKHSALEEVAAYSMQFRVIEAVGGTLYAEAREKAADDLVSGRTDDILGLRYDERLDKVYGPAGSEECRIVRRQWLGMAAIWHVAEQKNPAEELAIKEKLILGLYNY